MTPRTASSEAGFTLIELLVVVLIIGVLAAIALPGMFGQREKAEDVWAKNTVRNAVTQVEACIADTQAADVASDCSDSSLRGVLREATVGPVAVLSYTVTAVSPTGGVFRIRKIANRGFVRECDGTSRGCPSSGSW